MNLKSCPFANRYFDKLEAVEGKSFVITSKIEGSHIIAIKENGCVSFYTQQGQPYEGLADLEKEMKKWMPDNICLDGEITLLDPAGLAGKDKEKHGVKMLVFDCMTAKEFREQKCDKPYNVRRAYLHEWLYNSKEVYDKHVFQCGGISYDPLTCYHIHDLQYFEKGIRINALDAPYDFTRTNDLLKVEEF